MVPQRLCCWSQRHCRCASGLVWRSSWKLAGRCRRPRRRGRCRPAAGRRPSRPPSRGLGADRRHVLGVALLVAGLVDGEPHDVVGVDQGHGEEPRRGGVVGRHRVVLQPVGGVGGDDRVEVDPGPGPPHEVPVVAVPVGEPVGLHVGGGRTGTGATCRCTTSGSRRRRSSEPRVGTAGSSSWCSGMIMLSTTPCPGRYRPVNEAGPAGRARGRVGEVAGELEALGA